ncbi:glycosyltransferase [Archaeoglobus veneficus]|uniref:Glycosyl transferase group 1 n=1 Tax=Archaeoglobus veneficus (strain DSM 11195 / SNP6) TaxID=693661 RepID=F2KQM8_ARCVS|nr:glycosyltransferase [Archaeoglobus veneficus]AEA46590.1 glycosyl transferase group 1 [Archaeoglobus veneficus SNP6]
MKPRTIAIFGPSRRFLSGISYYTIRLSNALAEFVDVKAVLFRNMLPKRLFPGWRRVGEDLTKLEFSGKVNVYEILDWYNPFTWVKAYSIAKQTDAIVFQWWTSSVAHMYLAIELLNKLSGKKPVVMEFHEVVDPLEGSILPIRIYSRIMGKLIRKLASHYVVHSEEDREQISRIYKIPKEKISVIPHGIYDHYEKVDNAKKRLGINEEFVILFFGLLRPYKGVKYLLKAFEMLPEDMIKKSRLLIVGETWEDRESVKIAEESLYRDKITIVNRYVPDSEVSLYFSASDLVILPYTRASQSGVAHIAMSFGLPIIATKVGGLKEALSGYAGTHFIEPKSAESIARTIERVYAGKYKNYPPPENLRWSNVAKKWIQLLESISARF